TRMISRTESVRSNASIVCARTGLSPSKAKSLSNPMRSLLPPATMMALSMLAALHRESLNCYIDSRISILESRGQLPLHLRAQRLPVRAPRDFCLERFHHRPHLRLRGRADFGDCFAHESGKFIGAQPFRQVGIENLKLFFLLRRQLGPAAL